MNQKEAVYQAVVNITGHNGSSDGAVVITTEQRAQVNMVLCEGFESGKINLTEKYETEAELKSYVSGLISNWLRKDTRLNGGIKYQAKNPGSRAGSADPQLKALRALMSTDGLSDSDKAEIQSHIDARTSEINATKMAKTVDFSALPADLAAKFSK